MALPDLAIVEITYNYSFANQRYMNVLHYQKFAPQTVVTDIPTELDQIKTEAARVGAGTLSTAIHDCIPPNVDVDFVRVQEIYPSRSAVVDSGSLGAGSAINNAVTGNIAAVITKRTQFAGRDQVGAVHIPCVPPDECADGEIDNGGAYYASLQALAGKLIDNLVPVGTGALYRPVLFHRLTQPPTSTQVWSTIVQPQVRVMRRRTVGLGI